MCGLLLSCGDIQQRPLNVSNDSPAETDEPPAPETDLELRLDPKTLRLGRVDTGELTITVTPPGVHTVLVSIVGSVDAAYLSASQIETKTDGTASVEVSVLTGVPPFTVNATVGGVTASSKVEVEDRKEGVLQVIPTYSGLRPIETWAVGFVADGTCAELELFSADYPQEFPAEATDAGVSGTPGYAPISPSIPIQERYAVLLRGEEYVYGCREDVLLSAGMQSSVTIALADRPLRVRDINFGVQLGLENNSVLAAKIDTISQVMLDAFTAGHDGDLNALLGNMAIASENQPAFVEAQTNENWGEMLIASGVFAEAGAQSGLTSRLRLWLTQGLVQLFSAEALSGELSGAEGAPDSGLLKILTMANAAPGRLGLNDRVYVSLDTEGDTLQMNARLLWQQSRLLAGIAEQVGVSTTAATIADAQAPSTATAPAPTTMSEALAFLVDCPRVATILAGDDGIAFDGCETECLATSCQNAFVSMWESVVTADLSVARLGFSAAGPTRFDTQAKPLEFSGTWVGQIELGDEEPIEVRGPFAAGEELLAESQ